jgi:hypothetical protein
VDDTEKYASLLATGERVLVVRHRHWFTFIQAARWFVLIIAVGILSGIGDTEVGNHTVSKGLGWGFGLLVIVGLAGSGWFFLEWRRERYLVTSRRYIEAGGIINKHQRDTSLSMITDMIVGHPWIGRILGYGEIDLLTASEDGTNKIKFLPDADGFKKVILDAKYQLEMELGGGHAAESAPPAPVAAARPSADEVDASITKLAEMRDRGVISPEEFEQKRQELLGRL